MLYNPVNTSFSVKRPPDKSVYLEIIFLISQPKHMLWVLKRNVLMRRFFEQPKHMFKLMDKKIIAILGFFFFFFCFTGPLVNLPLSGYFPGLNQYLAMRSLEHCVTQQCASCESRTCDLLDSGNGSRTETKLLKPAHQDLQNHTITQSDLHKIKSS